MDADFRLLVVEADRALIPESATRWSDVGLTVRIVRGRKMRDLMGLFDEFAAALQFPPYFGENQDAFNECISELEGLTPQAGFVIIVTEPEEVLVDIPDLLVWLGESLTAACGRWSRPVERGEWWDRPAYPFHVVLMCRPGTAVQVDRHWTRAEIPLDLYESTLHE